MSEPGWNTQSGSLRPTVVTTGRAPAARPDRRVEVIGRLPSQASCLSLGHAVLDRGAADAGPGHRLGEWAEPLRPWLPHRRLKAGASDVDARAHVRFATFTLIFTTRALSSTFHVARYVAHTDAIQLELALLSTLSATYWRKTVDSQQSDIPIWNFTPASDR